MKVGCIGAGHIATALGRGWSRPGLTDPPALTYFDVDAAAARAAAGETGALVADSLDELVDGSHVIIVAVRPPQVAAVVREIAPRLGRRALVSVAAGVPLAELRAALPDDARAARVMPNIAARLGLGVFLFVPGSLGELEAAVTDLFALAGEVVTLDEADFDAATAVAGCMPGMLAKLVDDFAAAGRSLGLAKPVAERLAIAGVHGAAAVVAEQGDPQAVIVAAATPGGMTAAAVAALQEGGTQAAAARAVQAAAARAKELA